MANRLFVKITRENLPQIKDKYPFVYLERGRLEVDDSSVKWIDCDGLIVRLPCATINAILLGPGTSVTHEAIKVLAASNCTVSWVGEDSIHYYAAGQSPTSNTHNLRLQAELSCNSKKALTVAKRLFQRRFPDVDLKEKSLFELKGMEGKRVNELYHRKAKEYGVGWKGRSYVPGKFELSDLTNRILTSTNAALYGLLTAAVISLGYSPHLGFIHSGSPLPFDLADLYKDDLCIDTAFKLTYQLGGKYERHMVATEFRTRILESDLMACIAPDISFVLRGDTNGCSTRK